MNSEAASIGGLFRLTMSAIGTKRTWASALHMSAFGGKADIALLHCKCPLMTQSGHRLSRVSRPLPTRNKNQTGGDASVDWGGMIKIKYRCDWLVRPR